MKRIDIDIVKSKPDIQVAVMSKKPSLSFDILPPATIMDNDYNTLKNLPTINGETVIGEKSGKDYHLVNEDDFNGHVTDYNNPHQVTKRQVGLGNVDDTSDDNKPVSRAQAEAIQHVQDNLDEHLSDYENPHKTTSEQVGAVSKRLTHLTNVVIARPTLSMQHLYVDDNGEDKKVSMRQLKEMNTKVIMTNDIAKVDMNKLIVGDIIFEVK